jgi:hypothetical protein
VKGSTYLILLRAQKKPEAIVAIATDRSILASYVCEYFLFKILLPEAIYGAHQIIQPQRHIFNFLQWRLLDLTTYFGINLKKHCSESEHKQPFFKYFSTNTVIFEKICANVRK